MSAPGTEGETSKASVSGWPGGNSRSTHTGLFERRDVVGAASTEGSLGIRIFLLAHRDLGLLVELVGRAVILRDTLMVEGRRAGIEVPWSLGNVF